jgi:two-component system sensor histidine kinase DesK
LQVAYIWYERYPAAIAFGQLLVVILLGHLYHPMYTYVIFLLMNLYQKLSMRWIIGLTVGFAGSAVWLIIQHDYITQWQSLIIMMPPIFGGAILPYVVHISGRYKDMVERLQAATKEIERLAQQTERQRIAQELHDTLGHTLSLLALKGEVVEKLIPRAPDRAAAEAREIQQTATAALRRMRELVSDMKVVRLSEEWEHARSLCAAANIRLSIHDQLAEQGVNLTPLQESVIAMCLREALTNVVRHSRAAACTVKLAADESEIRCTIEDDGKGMDQQSAEMSGMGNGIAGMRQRLALLEGQLTMESASGKGLKMTMHIPIVRKQYGGEV